MRGDTIIVEPHHKAAATAIIPLLINAIEASGGKYTITVAGESGSGKSETALALSDALAERNIASVIFQQDDYFVYPPKSNDQARRADIAWVGPQEVKLDLLDRDLKSFHDGAESIEKPLVIYEDDAVTSETMTLGGATIAIAEGTYTTLLKNADTRIFIDRSYEDTRAHREKRKRHASELDPFIDEVLQIEHRIISAHKAHADIVINSDYSVSRAGQS
jgi:uridine kinase